MASAVDAHVRRRTTSRAPVGGDAITYATGDAMASTRGTSADRDFPGNESAILSHHEIDQSRMRPVVRASQDLEPIERASRDELAALQLARLKALMQHAY